MEKVGKSWGKLGKIGKIEENRVEKRLKKMKESWTKIERKLEKS